MMASAIALFLGIIASVFGAAPRENNPERTLADSLAAPVVEAFSFDAKTHLAHLTLTNILSRHEFSGALVRISCAQASSRALDIDILFQSLDPDAAPVPDRYADGQMQTVSFTGLWGPERRFEQAVRIDKAATCMRADILSAW